VRALTFVVALEVLVSLEQNLVAASVEGLEFVVFVPPFGELLKGDLEERDTKRQRGMCLRLVK